MKRYTLRAEEWLSVVNYNVYHTKDLAVQTEPELAPFVGEVGFRNDPANGQGLLFVRKAFFDFVLTIESGYFHSLKKTDTMLGTYMGDLPNEIFNVVRNSDVVKAAWEKMLSPNNSASPSVREVFDFLLTKWHNCRMGDHVRRVTETTKLCKEKASNLALRTTLKAVSGKSEKGNATGWDRGDYIDCGSGSRKGTRCIV